MPIGKLEPFDVNSKQWPAYVRRVKQYIVLNEIKDELRVPLLITVVGETTYSLMCDLSAPADPETKTFNELVRLMTDHLEPQRSEIAERHVFRLRKQRVDESMTEYLQELKHLATTCNFGIMLEENLRDQFVSGLANSAMRSRIFAEKCIKYKEAVELALALEAAERHAEVSASGVGGEAGEGLHAVRGRRYGGSGGRGGGSSGGSGKAQEGARTSAGSCTDMVCWRCGKPHRADRCRFVNYNCDYCNQRGHLKVMCKRVRNPVRAEYSKQQNFLEESSEEEFFNLHVSAIGNKPFLINIKVDDVLLNFEIDTGSRISAINEDCYLQLFKDKNINLDNIILRSYSGSRIEPLGYISVKVTLKYVTANDLVLYVIRGGGRPLLGRDWLRALKINQLCINEIIDDRLFSEKLGTCKKTLCLQLTDGGGVYKRARPVPLALRGRIERELERLERDGSIYRVEHSDFGTPIVPVVKSNGEIPRRKELFATLSNGEEYTKIDLRHAYEQVLLDEASQRFTAITTFVYRRILYGIPEIFQKLMEETLRGVPGTVEFLDYICTGQGRHTHLRNLRAVLRRSGLHPDPAKIEAIKDASEPRDVTQLKSFLGLLNYYGKIISNFSSLLHPQYLLLKKEAPWKWEILCAKAFEDAKRALLSERLLAHYEEGRPLVLSVDSSGYGLGAMLSHRYNDGSERPVSCVSRTLYSAEKNYSQLDKEALAIYFGITRHHQYLFGRKFVRRTDHKPLSFIFGVKGGIPQTAASRLQSWAARLAGYNFSVEFVRSTNNGPADALSRLPLSVECRLSDAIGYVHLVEDCLPINFKDTGKETKNDILLSKILGFLMFGCPSVANCEEEIPYSARKEEIYNISQALSKCLFQYRNCEHATTVVSPAVAMLGRRLRGRLDAVRPDVVAVVRTAQDRQVANAGGTHRDCNVGDPVLARDYSLRGSKWAEGRVVDRTGSVSFKVNMGNGCEWRRHQNQLFAVKKRYSLARTSTGTPSNDSSNSISKNNECEDADEFVDASNGDGTEESLVESSDLPPTGQIEGSQSPHGPNASARALRAYKRNKSRIL